MSTIQTEAIERDLTAAQKRIGECYRDSRGVFTLVSAYPRFHGHDTTYRDVVLCGHYLEDWRDHVEFTVYALDTLVDEACVIPVSPGDWEPRAPTCGDVYFVPSLRWILEVTRIGHDPSGRESLDLRLKLDRDVVRWLLIEGQFRCLGPGWPYARPPRM